MKKILILTFLLLSAVVVANAQEREKKVLELTNGNTVTGYVEQQSDGGWQLETESGDIIFYSAAEVKNVRLYDDENNSENENSQTTIRNVDISNPYIIHRKGSKLLFANDTEISSQKVGSSFYGDYMKYKKRYVRGIWVTASGAVSGIIGVALIPSSKGFTSSSESWNANGSYSSSQTTIKVWPLLFISAGTGLLVWGLVDWIGGANGLNGLIHQYNSNYTDSTVQLSIGAQQYGWGLALKF